MTKAYIKDGSEVDGRGLQFTLCLAGTPRRSEEQSEQPTESQLI